LQYQHVKNQKYKNLLLQHSLNITKNSEVLKCSQQNI